MTLHPTCLPSHPFLESLSQFFSVCIPTPLCLLSIVCGILSITSWLFSQLPQIIKNYRTASVEGLSPLFLLNWLLGDVCNFLGAIILHQMMFQRVIGGYYVLVDVCLMGQFIWYGVVQPRREKQKGYLRVISEDDYEEDSEFEHEVKTVHGAVVIEGLSPPESASSSAASSYTGSNLVESKRMLGDVDSRKKARSYSRSSSSSSLVGGRNSAQMMLTFAMILALATALPEQSSGRKKYVSPFAAGISGGAHVLDGDLPPFSHFSGNGDDSGGLTTDTIGKIIAWVSTALYCTSRLPQIYKNYSRRSTSGLSILLFIAAFFGNLFYSASLLTNPLAWNDFGPYGGGGIAGPEGSKRSEWWANSLPFFLGASGVLCQDALVFLQWVWWGENAAEGAKNPTVRVNDEVVIVVSDTGRGKMTWRQQEEAGRRLLPALGTPLTPGYGTVNTL